MVNEEILRYGWGRTADLLSSRWRQGVEVVMLLGEDATGVWPDALPLCLDMAREVEVLDLLDDVHTEEGYAAYGSCQNVYEVLLQRLGNGQGAGPGRLCRSV